MTNHRPARSRPRPTKPPRRTGVGGQSLSTPPPRPPSAASALPLLPLLLLLPLADTVAAPPPRRLASSSSSVGYGHYDSLLRSAYSNGTFISRRRAGNVDVVPDHRHGAPYDEVGICHVVGLIMFSRPVAGGGYVPYEESFGETAAAMMAMHHFNVGDGSVAPALEGINHKCPVRMTVEWSDTYASEFDALRLLTDVVTRDPSGPDRSPCAVVGATRSASSGPTSMLSSVHHLPQMSWTSASRDLSDRAAHPLFSRVIPSTDVLAEGAVRYLSDLGMKRCSVIFINDNFGNAFMRVFNQAAVGAGMRTLSVPFPPVLEIEDVNETISNLRGTGYRCIFAIFTSMTQYTLLMEEAYHQGVAGPEYFWLIGNNIVYTGQEFEAGSPLDLASRGVGQLELTGGTAGQRGYDQFHRAWADLDSDALEYLDSVVPRPPDALSSFMDVYEPDKPTPFALFAYDTAVAMALAACNVTDSEEYFTGEEHSHAIVQRTKFEGASGIVRINNVTASRLSTSMRLVIANLRGNPSPNSTNMSIFEAVESSVLQPNEDGTEWIGMDLDPFVYADGTTVPPPDLPPVNGGRGVDMNYIGGLRFIAYVLFAMIAILSAGLGAWIAAHRRSRVVAASQPLFLGMIIAGVVLMASAMIPFSVDDERFGPRGCDVACMSIPWLVCVGFVTTFSALFSKTWRVNKIISNPGRFQKVKVGVRDVIAPLVVFMGLNVIVLVCFTAFSPLRFVREIDRVGTDQFNRVIYSYGACVSTSGTGGGAIPYLIALLVINLSVLCFANYEAYRARTIETDYSESKFIAIAMAAILQSWLIGIPLLALVRDDPQVLFVLCTLILFVMSTAVLLLIFVPKILHLREFKVQKKKREDAKRERARQYQQAMASYDVSKDGSASSLMSEDEGRGGLGFRIAQKSTRKLGRIVQSAKAAKELEPGDADATGGDVEEVSGDAGEEAELPEEAGPFIVEEVNNGVDDDDDDDDIRRVRWHSTPS